MEQIHLFERGEKLTGPPPRPRASGEKTIKKRSSQMFLFGRPQKEKKQPAEPKPLLPKKPTDIVLKIEGNFVVPTGVLGLIKFDILWRSKAIDGLAIKHINFPVDTFIREDDVAAQLIEKLSDSSVTWSYSEETERILTGLRNRYHRRHFALKVDLSKEVMAGGKI